MGLGAARDHHPRRERQLGRQAARGAPARVAGVQFRPAQRLPGAPLRFQGEALRRARLCARRARRSGRSGRGRSERMGRAGVRRARIHGSRRLAALGRLSVRHTLRTGRGAPVAESSGQDFQRAHGRRRAFQGFGPRGQGHSAAGARLPAGAAGREPARQEGVRSLRPQAHAQNRDRDRRPARRFSGALDAGRRRNAARRRPRRRWDRARAARTTRRVPAVSAGRPGASGRNRSARQRPQLESRLDGRRGGSAALQRAGSFARLAARAHDRIPGFAGLTGRFEASEKGGSVVLDSERVAIELPGVVAESPLQFDTLAAHVGRKFAPDRFDLAFDTLSFANSDIAGTLFGGFARGQGGAGVIDLTGNFFRADGRAVYRYVPLLPARVVEYLKASIQGGHSNDVRLRLKGELAKFPFDEPGSGIFQIVAKVTDADFRYAEGWPRASGLSGDLIFEGKSMRIIASKGAVLDVQASSVRASIPDLFHGDVRVGVEVRAEDKTSDFLRFIAESPVTKALDGMTESMSAAGTGRLALQLDIPIRNPETFKLAGEFQLIDNEIRTDSDAPPFSHLNGRLEFTESGIAARALSAKFLGGPATII